MPEKARVFRSFEEYQAAYFPELALSEAECPDDPETFGRVQAQLSLSDAEASEQDEQPDE